MKVMTTLETQFLARKNQFEQKTDDNSNSNSRTTAIDPNEWKYGVEMYLIYARLGRQVADTVVSSIVSLFVLFYFSSLFVWSFSSLRPIDCFQVTHR
jgi:hypothetical protein